MHAHCLLAALVTTAALASNACADELEKERAQAALEVIREVRLEIGQRFARWRREASAGLDLDRLHLGALQDGADATDSSDQAGQTGDSADALAKQLANPVADLISVPLQFNFINGSGPSGDGFRFLLNVQPVVPFELNEDWMLITRVIVPVIYQNADASALTIDDDFGLGDSVLSLFFSPKADGKVTWGLGPVFYLPTATEDVLGADQWGIGPTGVVLASNGPWTYGILANHVWSTGRTRDYDSFFVDRPQVNATFLQPFVSYAIGDGWSVSFNTESSYDWEAGHWTIPLNAAVSKVTTLGDQLVSLGAGFQWYAEAPAGGPEWGFRFMLTFLFPK